MRAVRPVFALALDNSKTYDIDVLARQHIHVDRMQSGLQSAWCSALFPCAICLPSAERLHNLALHLVVSKHTTHAMCLPILVAFAR